MDLGKLLETKLYSALQQSLHSSCIIHSEDDLRVKYGYNATGIDFLIIVNNIIIPIQTKYRRSRRRETNEVNRFIYSVKYIIERMKKDVMFGLWVSRLAPFNDNQEMMATLKIECVDYYECMDKLVDLAIHKIQNKLCFHPCS